MTAFKLLHDVHAGCWHRWHHLAVREVRYELDDGLSRPEKVRRLCITGLPDHGLIAMAILGDDRLIWAIQSCLDTRGRPSTAGEMVAAMYGRCCPAGFGIPGAEVLKPGSSAPRRLRVHLRVAVQVDPDRIAVRLDHDDHDATGTRSAGGLPDGG